MKKYLKTGFAAVALCAGLASCSNHDEVMWTQAEKDQALYEAVFIQRFGHPASNHTWGFGTASNGTRSANPKGNMWEEDGWNVPPVITEAQKEIVRQYFQQNKDLGYTDPQWTNFFVQQVYKGGTNTGDGSLTTEIYMSADDTKNEADIIGSKHMDWLASKDANGGEPDHINNFNNGDNNDYEGCMLMEKSSTYSFGYGSSSGSFYHYDKAALVNWTVIRDWANAKGLNGNVLDDGLNRSYMGFDFEMRIGDDVYSNQTFEFDGNTYRYLSSEKNQYAKDVSEPTYKGRKDFNDVPNDDTKRELLKLGYLPVNNSNDKIWVKPGTCADGYYSDWIVSLTEGKQEIKGDCRVIAEDLTVDENGDFDFNDVVFDVKCGNPTTIILQAAGGTLPLYIEGNEVHEKFGVSTTTMVNTGAGAKKESVVFTIDKACYSSGDVANIKVEVEKNGERIELTALRGKVPSKICVGVDYEWCSERQDIEVKYPAFKEWVSKQDWDQFSFYK